MPLSARRTASRRESSGGHCSIDGSCNGARAVVPDDPAEALMRAVGDRADAIGAEAVITVAEVRDAPGDGLAGLIPVGHERAARLRRRQRERPRVRPPAALVLTRAVEHFL